MTKELMESTLFINEAFALRQHNGLPVFTSIETEILPHSKEFMDKYEHLVEKGYKLPDRQKRNKTDYPIDLSVLKRILITSKGKGYISTYFLEFCKFHKISIYFIDSKGMIEASYIPHNFVKASLVVKQCNAIINGKALDISKYLICQKLESQNYNHLISKINNAKDINQIIAIEGTASRSYYNKWSFDAKWMWNGRRGSNKSSNYLANDPINTTLNLGYSILAQKFSEILIKRGFELSIGFLHVNESRNIYWNMLAYDFIEPYRVWIDECVKKMISKKEIEPIDFTFAEDKSHMVFKDKALEIVIKRFMDALDPLEHKSLPVIRNVESMLSELDS